MNLCARRIAIASLAALTFGAVGTITSGTFAQDAKPAPAPSVDIAKTSMDVTLTDESEKLKVQLQLVLQENASLRKQLAQTQKALGDANSQLADLNEQQTNAAGPQLLKTLAEKHGLKSEDYEFKIDPQSGEMRFVKKEPAKEHAKR